MNVAFLFNSDDSKYGGYYGLPIRDTILSNKILQKSNRHMKVSVGDVLIHSQAKSEQHYRDLAEGVYFSHRWQRLFENKIRFSYHQATIYAWVIQNITKEITEKLHSYLTNDSSYLGVHVVNFSNPLHMVFYRNSMIPQYRIIGNTCNIFFSMSEDEYKDDCELDEIAELGFDNVFWEDTGAHRTIFDNFDTSEHFKRIENFRLSVSPHISGGEDQIDEFVMLTEDLSPRLFDTLNAAVQALKRAQTEEDLAQIGLSGRRYFEQLADALFPEQTELHNGREVTKNKHKNRLWAYISDSTQKTNLNREIEIETLGKEVDRLFKKVNSILHADSNENEAIQCLVDITKLSITLLSLDPEKARKPYYAFEQTMEQFFTDVLKDAEQM